MYSFANSFIYLSLYLFTVHQLFIHAHKAPSFVDNRNQNLNGEMKLGNKTRLKTSSKKYPVSAAFHEQHREEKKQNKKPEDK